MMLTKLGVDPQVDFVPHAVIGRSASYLQHHNKVEFTEGADDLDRFEGALLKLDDEVPIALRHYAGHTENTVTVYIPSEYTDVDVITRIIALLSKELQLQREDILWQRAQDPDL